MYQDVIDLKAFYGGTLGSLARRRIAAQISRIWPSAAGERVLGLGYATPYLDFYRETSERTLAFMPAAQGVIKWPSSHPSASALVLDGFLPLPDACIDRALVVHSLENTDNPEDLLREVWRVLAPGGRVLVIVPNRRGVWCRMETTPFGYGRPFSRGQMTNLLRESLFVPTNWAMALHMPPAERKWLVRSSNTFERMGNRFWPAFAGVIMVEASKQLYKGVAATKRGRLGRLRPVLVPQGAVPSRVPIPPRSV